MELTILRRNFYRKEALVWVSWDPVGACDNQLTVGYPNQNLQKEFILRQHLI